MPRPPTSPRARRFDAAAVYLARRLAGLFLRTFYGVRVRGLEHLPRRGPAILAPNHQSHYDSLLAGFSLRCRTYWMVAGIYYHTPVLRGVVRTLGGFPVDGPRDRRAYRHILELLAAGEVVAIFPEGRRSDDGGLSELQAGAARAALATGATVVPVTIVGAYEVWPRHRLFPRCCRSLVVEYHPPIPCAVAPPAELKPRVDELNARLAAVYRPRLEAWRRLARRRGR